MYATAMTCKEYNNDIRRTEPEKVKEKLDMPKWIYYLEESISRVRRKVNQINVLIKCKTEKQFTTHQKDLLNKFLKNYGNTKMKTLEFKCTMLKQDLKSKTEKLKYQKKIIERKKIWNNPSECIVANVDWTKELENKYCLNATQKLYEIDIMAIGKAINKLKPNKALGRDMITGYWYKQLNFYGSDLIRLYNSTLINDQVLPT